MPSVILPSRDRLRDSVCTGSVPATALAPVTTGDGPTCEASRVAQPAARTTAINRSAKVRARARSLRRCGARCRSSTLSHASGFSQPCFQIAPQTARPAKTKSADLPRFLSQYRSATVKLSISATAPVWSLSEPARIKNRSGRPFASAAALSFVFSPPYARATR
jgi:hypothetical protein